MKHLIFFSFFGLLSSFAFADTHLLNNNSPRFFSRNKAVIYGSRSINHLKHYSVYDDYNDDKCTQPLLYDGVCPDYLQGGCALTNSCEYQSDHAPVLFSDGQ